MTALSAHKNIQKAWRLPGLLALCVLAFAGSAQAQYSSDTNNRIKRLENEIETLSRAIYKGEDPPPGAFSGGSSSNSADTEVRLQQMESQIRDLNGKLEEQSYQIRQMQEQLERSLSDFELRLGDMLGGGAAPGAGAGSAGGMPPQPDSSVTGSYGSENYDSQGYSGGAGARTYQDSIDAPDTQGAAESAAEGDYQWSSSQRSQDTSVRSGQLGTLTTMGGSGATTSSDAAAAQYENAFALLKNGQYDTAEIEFNSFISENPDHILISNAKYWLGETYYVRGKFEDAARVFAEGYKEFPKGSKAADNLLKLGMSLAGMGNTDDACVALGQLEKDFPTGAGPVLRRAEQEKSRLSCS